MSRDWKRGNCYVATEALYHILGGVHSPWRPQVMRFKGNTHWFLKHKETCQVLDPSRLQFEGEEQPDYSQGRGCGFLTRQPSKRARSLIRQMTWQSV